MLLRLCLLFSMGLVPGAGGLLGQDVSGDTLDQRFVIPETNEGLPGKGPIRRYDWFQKLWQQRRAEWARQIDKDQGAIVFWVTRSLRAGEATWGGLSERQR